MPKQDEIKEVLYYLRNKPYYLSQELAVALNVSRVTIQRTAKKHGIGKISKCERGSRGVRVFTPDDVVKLVNTIINNRKKFPGK